MTRKEQAYVKRLEKHIDNLLTGIFNALLGFAAGIFTLPLAAAAWPFVAAWFMWNETDDDGEDEE